MSVAAINGAKKPQAQPVHPPAAQAAAPAAKPQGFQKVAQGNLF